MTHWIALPPLANHQPIPGRFRSNFGGRGRASLPCMCGCVDVWGAGYLSTQPHNLTSTCIYEWQTFPAPLRRCPEIVEVPRNSLGVPPELAGGWWLMAGTMRYLEICIKIRSWRAGGEGGRGEGGEKPSGRYIYIRSRGERIHPGTGYPSFSAVYISLPKYFIGY